MRQPPNFDRLARLYQPLEHLTFGPLLARTRTHFLPELRDRRQALVFGDGDGRFLARLLAQNPALHADAVDLSRGMLAQLERRCALSSSRLHLHAADALHFTPKLPPQLAPDLVVTHFFLDCLTPTELAQLIPHIAAHMQPGALWLVSEFRIPPRGPSRLLARLLVRSLYLAFRLLTGLRVTHLPDYAGIFRRSGLTRIAHHDRLFGILQSELWSRP